jgi:hypothetical protein
MDTDPVSIANSIAIKRSSITPDISRNEMGSITEPYVRGIGVH